ncbi:MAG: flagellar basal-body MS-ring/collar protein FliF [Candidatus Wallbacteria bacterium]
MLNYFKLLFEQFQKLATWQKVTIYITAGVLFVAIIAVSYLYTAADYVLLYRGLEPESAANIKEKLDEGSYIYKLADNGSTIYVSSSQKDVILLKLAKDNVLPDRSKGYSDIFGTTNNAFSSSRKIEDLNILRALQAELETTIKKSSKLISSVRIHIFYAPERTFKEDQKEDKATVYLVLKPGKKLEDDQIIGIRNLICNGTGILEENISIIDQNFVDLSKRLKSNKPDENIATDQFKLQKDYIDGLQSKLQDVLDKILGHNMAVVTVFAELNFDKREAFDEFIEPPIKGEEGGMVVSEEVIEENYKGLGKKPAGVPGTQSNIPTYPDVKEGKDEYAKKEARKNYDTNKKKLKTVYAIGDVKKLSISVMIDEIVSKEQQAKIENSIASAAGLTKGRGDTLTVERFPFNREPAKEQEKQAQKAKFEDMLFQLLLVTIPTAAIIFILWFIWKNKELLITYFKPIQVKKEVETPEEMPIPAEARDRMNKIETIKQFIDKSPKEASTLLQIWITSD